MIKNYARSSIMRITPNPQESTHMVISHDAETKKNDCALRITFFTHPQKMSARKKLFPNTQSITTTLLIFKIKKIKNHEHTKNNGSTS